MNTVTDGEAAASIPWRRTFGTGLGAGLIAGVLLGAAFVMVTVLMLPAAALESLRGEHLESRETPSPTATPTPTPLPTGAWLDSTTSLPLDVTQPGTLLGLGDAAIVQVASAGDARTLVEITAVTVDAAPAKDQRTLRTTAPVLTGQTVYYARVAARWVAGDPLDSTAVGEVFALIDSGGVAIPSLTLLDWEPCAPPTTTANFSTATEPTEWCIAAASPVDGLVPVGVRFSQAGGPYESAEAEASVRWMP